jgi:branched-chain amino acid transport system permease protein
VVVVVGVAGTLLPANMQFLLATMVIYALLAISANMVVGWHGTMTFGHTAFFGVGIYSVALLQGLKLNPLLAVLIGGLVGAAFALVFSLLTLRLTGIGFTMMTMVFGQVLWLLLFTIPGLHGDDGIPGVIPQPLFGVSLLRSVPFLWYALFIVGVCALALRAIHRSTFGQAIFATRDDPVRAAALGIPITALRTCLLIIAGFFAGIAGALFVQQQGIASSDTLYWLMSGNIVLMCLVGGRGHFWGPGLGAVVFMWLNTQLFSGIYFNNLFIGLILLVIVLALPGGLASIPVTVATRARQFWRRKEANHGQSSNPGTPGSA